MARGWGCNVVINRQEEDNFDAATIRHTIGGRGFDVVNDNIGRNAFQDCLQCLTRMGTLVCYDHRSGSPAPFGTWGIISDRCLRVSFPKIPYILGKRLELNEIAKKVIPKAGEEGMKWLVVDYGLEQVSLAQEMKETLTEGQVEIEDYILII